MAKLNYELSFKAPKQGTCTSCGFTDDIEFTNEKWRWVNGTTFCKTNCPSCGEWRSLAILETKIETVPAPPTPKGGAL